MTKEIGVPKFAQAICTPSEIIDYHLFHIWLHICFVSHRAFNFN